MLLADLLDSLPAPAAITAADVRQEIDARTIVVVLDDDPTGTQSVAQLPVLTRWSPDDVREAISAGSPAFYLLTNTRSLDETAASARVREIVRVVSAEADAVGCLVTFVVRGDSTLRGHFPLETDVIAEERQRCGAKADLTLLVPAFPDAGRVTVDAVHYVASLGEVTPVGETAFARDATFGFASSNLRDWVAEKTQGRIARDDVAALTIGTIRRGPEAILGVLAPLAPGATVVVDAVAESDMRAVAIALHRLADRRFLLRVGPPYVRAHIGQEPAKPVTADQIHFPNEQGGLVVVGSHVPLTTVQLDRLRQEEGAIVDIELDARRLLGSASAEYVAERAQRVVAALRVQNVIVHTSRAVITGADGDESLAISRAISGRLVELVRTVVRSTLPRFIIAKGGITSSDIATEALEITRATVLGPLLPGLVSLWRPESGPAVGVPYVVFAGNVGGPDSLTEVVRRLSSTVLVTHREGSQ